MSDDERDTINHLLNTGQMMHAMDIIARNANLPSAEDQLRDLENSVREEYLTDALFHSQVHVGASIIEHLYPGVARRDALRGALLVLAAAQRAPE
jgi:hypothetical protein